MSELKIRFSSSADASVVSDYTTTVLTDIAREVGIDSFVISSTMRNPLQQARAMVAIILGTADGLARSRKLYREPGQHVLDVYERMASARIAVQQIIHAMAKRIEELGPANVSHHCGDPAKLNVLDIKPSSIPVDKHDAFVKAAGSDPRVSKVLGPTSGDPAFHLEIPQPVH